MLSRISILPSLLLVLSLLESSAGQDGILDSGESREYLSPYQIKSEYPLVVPKRGALLLDRIFVELQKSLQEEKTNPQALYAMPPPEVMARQTGRVKYMQRRGAGDSAKPATGKARKCYFNVITCFK